MTIQYCIHTPQRKTAEWGKQVHVRHKSPTFHEVAADQCERKHHNGCNGLGGLGVHRQGAQQQAKALRHLQLNSIQAQHSI